MLLSVKDEDELERLVLAYTPKFGRVTQCTNDETKSYLTESLAVDGSSGAHYVGIYLDRVTNNKENGFNLIIPLAITNEN